MKKVLILTAAAILSMSSIAISQAEEVENTPATEVSDTEQATAEATDETSTPDEQTDTEATDGEETAVDAEGSEEQDATAAIDAEDIPQDTPQVQKLIALYPQLVARIEPYGKVCFEGEECDVTVTATGPSADGKPRDGETVYNAVCHTCHAAGLLGSPKFGDAGAWGPRIAKGKDTLYDHALHGFNAMPAKGGADIPDEEVENAVNYMVSAAS